MEAEARKKRVRIIALTAVFLLTVFGKCIKITQGFPNRFVEGVAAIFGVYFQIIILILWGASIKRRIIDKRIMRYLMHVTVAAVFWLILRGLKYYLITDVDIKRILWYMYYIPMQAISTFSLIIAYWVGKPENKSDKRMVLFFEIIPTLLIILVLTNDFHQLVFRFPDGAVTFSDAAYTYGVGFFMVQLWNLSCAIAAIIIMILKCRHMNTRRIWAPIAILVIMVVFSGGYAVNPNMLVYSFIDIMLFQSFVFAAFFESFIFCGLIGSNRNYRKLFESLNIPIYLLNNDYEVRTSGVKDRVLARDIIEELKHNTMCFRNDERYSIFDIKGGHAIWAENVSEINGLIGSLRDTNEALEEYHDVITEEYKANREKTELEEIGRIYTEMNMETRQQLDKMQELLQTLAKTDSPEAQTGIMRELIATGAYYKRRNNLLFLQKSGEIPSVELDYCIRETLEGLRSFSINGSHRVDLPDTISFYEAVQLYDSLYKIIKSVLDELMAIAVIVGTENNCHVMRADLCVRGDVVPFEPADAELEDEGDGEFVLTVRAKAGEQA